MNNKKLYEDYNSMSTGEKFAMRYDADGRSLGDVVRNNPEKTLNPNKLFDAWVKGEDMRKNGTSKNFLEGIENAEFDELAASASKRSKTVSGRISAEPIKDIWGNSLNKNVPNIGLPKNQKAGRAYDITEIPGYYESFPSFKSETLLYTGEEENDANNLLQIGKNGDIMNTGNTTNYSNSQTSDNTKQVSSDSTTSSKTHVTYGYPDVNIVGGIQYRLDEMGYKGINGATLSINGIFDKNTEAAIKQFQKDRGLPVTGILDDATKKEMGFSEDYSISRKGKNITPWHAPDSPPFNLESYNREQEKLKREKEEAKKSKEEEDDISFLEMLLLPLIIREIYKNTATSGADLAEENMQPENSNEDLNRAGNPIDGSIYPYPVEGYN